MLMLCDKSKADNVVDEESLVKTEKKYSLKRCAWSWSELAEDYYSALWLENYCGL